MARQKTKTRLKKNGTVRKPKLPTAYFHITDPKNVPAILQDGLKGGVKPRNRGGELKKPSIFVLVDPSEGLHDDVAMNQVWPFQDIETYAVIRIDTKGVGGQVMADNVAEFAAVFARVIEQDVIAPEFLTLERIRELNFPGRQIMDLMQDGLLKEEKWTAEEWALAAKWCHSSVIENRKHIERQIDEKTKDKEKK
ncbi:MAG: hypothetical protein JNK93_10405 [Planctomycetia bacterium]|nr:hypothetical protein [Planctomycetia bacterium]